MKKVLTPERYIKTKARTLPILKCYIKEDWENDVAYIWVVRVHTNGNYTYGGYKVDLRCLGLVDTFYGFNEDSSYLEQQIKLFGDIVLVDYVVVHNIIYAGIGYAEELGFKTKPKDWPVSSYILEEDTDDIAYTEIEVGLNGQPVYFPNFDATPAQMEKVKKTLDKSVGEGNYKIVLDENLLEMEDDEEEKDLMTEFISLFEFMEESSHLLPNEDVLKEVVDSNKIELFVQNRMMVGNQFYAEDVRNEEAEDMEELLSIFNPREAIYEEHARKLVKYYPNDPFAMFLLYENYLGSEKDKQAEQLANEISRNHPDFILQKLLAAYYLMRKNQYEKGFDMLNRKYYLDEAFPRAGKYAELEVLLFHVALSSYFVEKDHLKTAFAYLNPVHNYIDKDKFLAISLLELQMKILDISRSLNS